jgi:hypothetical protein
LFSSNSSRNDNGNNGMSGDRSISGQGRSISGSSSSNNLVSMINGSSATHHIKMMIKLMDIEVTETYAVTQEGGESGFELRILGHVGTKEKQEGYSPYNAYAIWCLNPNDKIVLKDCIQKALKSKLDSFFSRKNVVPPPTTKCQRKSEMNFSDL